MKFGRFRREVTPYQFSQKKEVGVYPLSLLHHKSDKAFTLIELLTVCAIIAIVTALVLANQNKFGGKVLLQNFAYDVALSIRQAQVYGISVFGQSVDTGRSFSAAYGMHFAQIQDTHYLLFADSGADDVYGAGDSVVPPSPLTINRGFRINNLCTTVGGGETCGDQTIDIVFVRPEPDALISWKDAGGTQHFCKALDCASSARIQLISPRGDTMSVDVESNGQIAVAPN